MRLLGKKKYKHMPPSAKRKQERREPYQLAYADLQRSGKADTTPVKRKGDKRKKVEVAR